MQKLFKLLQSRPFISATCGLLLGLLLFGSQQYSQLSKKHTALETKHQSLLLTVKSQEHLINFFDNTLDYHNLDYNNLDYHNLIQKLRWSILLAEHAYSGAEPVKDLKELQLILEQTEKKEQ